MLVSQKGNRDVIPHSKGGKTTLENGELLCSYHNQSKGASLYKEA
ncbi:MAG: hypothetical protein GQ532_09630 [Methylomarinum sp.]|nr:hypothetical protein [Methylomarinum sp.]